MAGSYTSDLEALAALWPDLHAQLAGVTMLEGVFEWIRGGGTNTGGIDLLQQDEFSHDVIVELLDTGSYIVFGCT